LSHFRTTLHLKSLVLATDNTTVVAYLGISVFCFFCGVSVAQALVSCELFCKSLFVLLSFSFLSLHCQSYFDFQLLITSLISLNFSRNNSNYIFIVETRIPLVKESNYNSCKINKVYKWFVWNWIEIFAIKEYVNANFV
jgi:hypothetical protein